MPLDGGTYVCNLNKAITTMYLTFYNEKLI